MNAASRDFTVGALSFRLDPSSGFVRSLRFRGHEILRGIYPAVRDPDWRTILPSVAPAAVDATSERVTIALAARIDSGPIALEWRADIVAEAKGKLSYRWHARALTSFVTNRTGLCVLHPAAIAGAPCTIEHADGATVAAWFPQRISPHQPFRNVRALTHVFAPRAEVTVRMEGEIFETEDQRNWTDASFKTYCRPLDWPRPYPLAAGEVIAHTVTVAVRGEPAPRRRIAPTAIQVQAATASTPLPRIGFTLAEPIPAELRARVRALRPSHFRVETTPGELAVTLAWARDEAARAGCELDAAIRGATTEPPARTLFPADGLVHLFDPHGNAASPEVLAAWRQAGFTAIATGTSSHFTELNRQHPPAAGDFDVVTFGINAQVHAFDEASMLETLSQHAVVTRHARELGAGRPVCVAPIVLGPTADAADERLHSGFGARWLLGSLARLAATGGVARVTLFRPHGPGGFLLPNRVTPIEHLLLLLAGATHARGLTLDADPEAAIDALLLASADGKPARLVLGHDGDSPLSLEIPWSGEASGLGESPAPFAAGRATLPPHAGWQLEISG